MNNLSQNKKQQFKTIKTFLLDIGKLNSMKQTQSVLKLDNLFDF